MAMRQEQEKEGRVEILRRQSARRMANSGLSNAWAAWTELWEARAYAIKRLREVGNKLRAPEKADAFYHWSGDASEQKAKAELARLEKESKSLEAQLRRARHERHQLDLVRVAHEDELRALHEKLKELSGWASEQGVGAASHGEMQRRYNEMQLQHAEALASVKEAEQLRLEAEEDAERQREENRRLLERLLADQRRTLEGYVVHAQRTYAPMDSPATYRLTVTSRARELRDSERLHKDELNAEIGQREALQAELNRVIADGKMWKAEARKAKSEGDSSTRNLKAELETLRAAASQKEASLKDEIERLKKQLAAHMAHKQKTPPPAAPPADRKKTSSVLGNFDLDESPGAPPVSQQLANALRANAGRVLDLFRDWDTEYVAHFLTKATCSRMPDPLAV